MIDLSIRLQNGWRDCRGADLRNADLKNTDLRGALFGPGDGWRQLTHLIGIAAGIVSGAFMVCGALLASYLFNSEVIKEGWLFPGLLTLPLILLALFFFVRRGAGLVPSAVAGVSTIGGAVIIIIGTADGGVNVAIAAAVAGAATGAVAFAVAAAAAAAAARTQAWLYSFGPLAGIVSAVGSGAKILSQPLPVSAFVVMLAVEVVVVWLIRRRALRGAPEHAWARNLAVALLSLGGARFHGAELGQADFMGSHLAGADLRGARVGGTRFRGSLGLEWARFDPGDLRQMRVQRLLMSGDGRGQDYAGLRLREVVLAGSNLAGANLSNSDLCGADLSGADLSGANVKGMRIDALTYTRSGWTPRMLADLDSRQAEIVALAAFPPAAQDVVVGLRDGLVLSFEKALTHFKQHLIEGSLYAIVGIESQCRIAEYREKDDGTSFVRIVGSDRIELERVAEAFYRRVWEQSTGRAEGAADPSPKPEKTPSPIVLTDQLRGWLSETMHGLTQMELRVPTMAKTGAPSGQTQLQGPGSRAMAASEAAWSLDVRADRFFGVRPRRVVVLHSPSATDISLCGELVRHLAGLKRAGLLATFSAPSAGAVVEAAFAGHIAEADVVLALVSSDFLADQPCQARLVTALAGPAPCVPVLARACDWRDSELGQRQCLPESGRPVSALGADHTSRDEGWVEVVSGLRRLLRSLG